MPSQRTMPHAERYWSRVEKTETCWLWTHNKNPYGYGQFFANGKNHIASRVAWQLWWGPIPEGMSVLHHCDVPACVNPLHLWLGTHADNMADKVRKGRQHRVSQNPKWLAARPRGDDSWQRRHPERVLRGNDHWSKSKPELIPRGERAGLARLNETQVRDIRARYAAGGVTHKMLAQELGVSVATVTHVISRRTWSHVD